MMTQKEETYQVVLDIIKNTTFYKVFLATADVPEIFMQQFWLVPPKKTRDVAFKLGKSINKTNAKIADEISRVYETHARVTIRDTPRVSKKKLVDQSQKLKGIQTLNAKEQLAANMMQALKASKKSNRSRSHTGGSSEGTSIIPGVPDESTFIIANSNKGTEDKSDSSTESDELKGIEKEKIEEKEIEWVSTNEKDEQLDDQDDDDDRIIDIEKTDDEEETDDGRVHGVEYVHDDVDEEMKDTEVVETRKDKEEIFDAAKESADTEINSLLDIQIQQEVPHIQSSSVLTVLVLVTPEPTILLSIPKIPIVTLITTLPPPPPVTNITPVLRVLKGALKQVDHALAILATTRSQVPVAVDKYLGSRLGDALQKKSALSQTMIESKSFNKHPSNIALYHALMESLLSDEEGMDQGVTELLKKKRQHDDQDEDPLAGPNHDQPQDKSEPKTIRAPRNDWFIQPPRAPTSDPELNQGKEVDNGQEQTWFNDMLSTKKVPLTFDELIAASIDFSNFAMNRLKIDKLTKAHLVGLIYELLKGTCQSCLGHLTVASEYIYNNDLAYPKLSNPEKKYTMSITKTKADMLLLVVQHKLFHLDGEVIVDLALAMRVVYANSSNQKRLMRADELYKFLDGALKNVRDTLHHNATPQFSFG
ncbi:hypothetical protein Tco_1129532 [Tanacetum coccineum]